MFIIAGSMSIPAISPRCSASTPARASRSPNGTMTVRGTIASGIAGPVRTVFGTRGRAGVVERRVHRELHVVVVAVVRALDLDDLRSAGRGAHEVDRVHRRLGAGVAEPPPGQTEPAGELLGHDDRVGHRLREVRSERDPVGDRPHDRGVGVTDEHHAEAGVQVDVLGAVDVVDLRALAVGDPHGLRRRGLPVRRDAADERPAGLVQQRARARHAVEEPRLLGRRRARRRGRDPGRGRCWSRSDSPLEVPAGNRRGPLPHAVLLERERSRVVAPRHDPRAGRSRTRPSPGGW